MRAGQERGARVLAAADGSATPMRILAQNRSWSLVWNLGPFAAAGLVPPWLAALGMSLSSLAMVLNALRIGDARAPRTGPVALRERTA